MKTPHFGALCCALLAGCAPGTSQPGPFASCLGTYAPLDSGAQTEFGYSADQAIDRFGLDHTGTLSWRFVDGVIDDDTYTQPLPDTSGAEISLDVAFVRWAKSYRKRPTLPHRNVDLAIVSTGTPSGCPESGLEVRLEGSADYPDLGLHVPLNGWLLATRRAGRASPSLASLAGPTFTSELSDDSLDPLRPSLDAFLDFRHNASERQQTHTVDELVVRMTMGLKASSATLGMDLRWHETADGFDSVIAATAPFAPELVLDAE